MEMTTDTDKLVEELLAGKSGAVNALMRYHQADDDGVLVLASRQAIHEVTDNIQALCQRYNEMKEALEGFIATYDERNPMRTADFHVDCDCLRCQVDKMRVALNTAGKR